MERDIKMGLLIPFDRSAETLRRMAVNLRKRGKLLPALECLRKSEQKDPDDLQTRLEMAQVLAEMHCYELSNRALFSLFASETLATEAFYLAGENFFAMHLEPAARDCFVLYLQRQPDGRRAADAVDMIEALEDQGRYESPMDRRISRRTQRVLEAMMKEQPRLAIRLMRRVLPLDKKSSGAHALLAFAQLHAEEPQRALAAAKRAMQLNSDDIRAQTAMAAALFSGGETQAAHGILHRALDRASGMEDLDLICRTACDVEDHACVREVLIKLEAERSLSDEVLHTLAAANYNVGKKDEALRCWRLLRRINPQDMAAEYRLRAVSADMLPMPVPYTLDVAQEEILLCLSNLRAHIQRGAKAVAEAFAQDDAIERFVRWGLMSGEPGIPDAMLGLLTTIPTARARRPLVDMLSHTTCPDDQKRNALAALALMGDSGPHYALIGERITMVHVSQGKGQKEQDAERADALLLHVKRRLGDDIGVAEDTLLRLADAAAMLARQKGNGVAKRGLEMALRILRGEEEQSMQDVAQRRRLLRYAKRIMKEAGVGGMHQL